MRRANRPCEPTDTTHGLTALEGYRAGKTFFAQAGEKEA